MPLWKESRKIIPREEWEGKNKIVLLNKLLFFQFLPLLSLRKYLKTLQLAFFTTQMKIKDKKVRILFPLIFAFGFRHYV